MSEKLKLYKVLNKDLSSPFRHFQFVVGKVYHEANIDFGDGDCSRGFYATDIDGIFYSYNKDRVVFECEVWGGRKEFDQFKRRFEYIKLIRKIPKHEIKAQAQAQVLEYGLGYKLSEILFPIKPLRGKAKIPTNYDIKLLREWVSLRDSVKGSSRNLIWDSVWSSVRNSVWGPVWVFVWNFVRNSTWESIWRPIEVSVRTSQWTSVWDFILTYTSSLFPGIEEWEGINHEPGENPYQSAISLWKRGFVASFDGEFWYLFSGSNAKVVYKINKEEI